MTIKKLQAKLAETRKELATANRIVAKLGESDGLVITLLQPYKCKVCSLFHFPEPLTKCEREKDNKERLAREKRQRERYFNEFKAVVKRCTDHGKVDWHLVESSNQMEGVLLSTTTHGASARKRVRKGE